MEGGGSGRSGVSVAAAVVSEFSLARGSAMHQCECVCVYLYMCVFKCVCAHTNVCGFEIQYPKP